MKKYIQEKFTGERAMFMCSNVKFNYCTFEDGESPLKESENLIIKNSSFQWKYPLWYCKDVVVEDSTFFEMSRAGIWYTDNISVKNTSIDAPKEFRRCNGVTLENVNFSNAAETLWNCENVKMSGVTAKGDYFAMGSHDMEIENFTLFGNYPFDGAKNIALKNVKMMSKDAFWNCDYITIYDSYISGEYFGWNSKNITLVNCMVESLQGMCYMKNLVMKNCRLLNTNLAFEYSTVDVEVSGSIDSVKNPISGKITADKINEIIFDDDKIDSTATLIQEGLHEI